MEQALEIPLVIALALGGSLLAWRFRFLTPTGATAAAALATAIGLAASPRWTVALLVFPVIAFLATIDYFKQKEERGLQEGEHGERSHANVLGVALIPAAISVAYALSSGRAEDVLAVAFVSAVAVSTADTVASEVGVTDRHGTWMITTLEPCEPGLNGGVSRLGIVSSLGYSVIYSIVAWAVVFDSFGWQFLIPAAAGMAGNLLDSVVGAVWENRGKISKYGVNRLTQLAGAAIGALLYAPFA